MITIDRARELDRAVADAYRSDRSSATSEAVWNRLARSIPTLLGEP
ncbi:MAG: hypothetical protein ACRD0W_16100 [Acidimicrobiales bacterium]